MAVFSQRGTKTFELIKYQNDVSGNVKRFCDWSNMVLFAQQVATPWGWNWQLSCVLIYIQIQTHPMPPPLSLSHIKAHAYILNSNRCISSQNLLSATLNIFTERYARNFSFPGQRIESFPVAVFSSNLYCDADVWLLKTRISTKVSINDQVNKNLIQRSKLRQIY